MLKILADQNIYRIKEFLPDEILLECYDPTNGIPDLTGFDALFVRTVSKLNETTLPVLPNSLKLIGTGSSGSDHIETEYFEGQGIKIIDAKGCNANAVSEYIITSLLLWGIKKQKNLQKLKVGIIGAGATGSAVAKQLAKFEISFCSYDPPRQEREPNFKSALLEDVLSCDVLTFHVPLSKKGTNSTHHWLDAEKLESQKFELIINASRGGVIDELALMEAMNKETVKDVIIDVWEGEPDFNTALVGKAFIATPHIAGYSEQATLNASKILTEKFIEFFDIEISHSQKLYAPKVIDIADLNYSFYELLLRLHPLREYDADIRNLCLRPDKAVLFQKLRTDRPYRFEYPYLKLNIVLMNELKTLTILGVETFNTKS